MSTTRSVRMAEDFLSKGKPFKRKIQTYQVQLSAKPEEVFELLCPTREVDWLDGWIADLIFTDSGYAEPDCVLTTPESCVLGAGLWIITRRETNKLHEFVVIREDGVVGHFTIEIVDNGDGTCETFWTLVFTALNEAGNALIGMMPDKDPDFEVLVIGGLEYYLKTGELMKTTR